MIVGFSRAFCALPSIRWWGASGGTPASRPWCQVLSEEACTVESVRRCAGHWLGVAWDSIDLVPEDRQCPSLIGNVCCSRALARSLLLESAAAGVFRRVPTISLVMRPGPRNMSYRRPSDEYEEFNLPWW